MRRSKIARASRWLLGPAALVVTSSLTLDAQIERLTLNRMVEVTDDAVYAEIVGKRVFRIDHPVDGPELYFTTLTLKGRSLQDSRDYTTEVTYPGGFISETEGVWNSEAPSEDDVKLGNRVVVFYGWLDNMGGDVSGNRLWASHGGLFRTVDGPEGPVVLGRGEGYAISANRKLTDLDTAVTTLARDLKKIR
jgi:hypothetical protein